MKRQKARPDLSVAPERDSEDSPEPGQLESAPRESDGKDIVRPTAEWLETDGRGGFASGSADGAARRRYHGLLLAPGRGSPRRYLLLSRLEATLRTASNGTEFRTATTFRAGARADDRSGGWRRSFSVEPFPRFRYSTEQWGLQLEHSILMPKGHHAILCRFDLRLAEPCRLELAPFLPFREADALTIENRVFDPTAVRVESPTSKTGRRAGDPAGDPAAESGGEETQALAFCPYEGLPGLLASWTDPRIDWVDAQRWDRHLAFPTDEGRGYHGREDQCSPGYFRMDLDRGDHAFVLAFATERPVADPGSLWERVARIRRATWQLAEARSIGRPESKLRTRLDTTADDFLQIDRQGRLGVCAGYPWFLEWGRDTFLSLPGLTIPRGRITQCQTALRTARRFVSDGLLPNVFGHAVEDSLYNSADAALWYLRCVDLYLEECVRTKLCEKGCLPEGDEVLRTTVEEILDRYTRPPRTRAPEVRESADRAVGPAKAVPGLRPDLGIWLSDDGLLHAGSESLNATWMDARTAAGPVTPRSGSPVELQALLYLGLDLAQELATAAGDEAAARRRREQRDLVGATLTRRFWIEDPRGGFLADRLEPSPEGPRPVAELRPNMVLAAALRRSPLSPEQVRSIVDRCEHELLTPRGLRTLSPTDPQYCSTYEGDQDRRDHAYHQGTVWPWLLGSYVEAALRSRGPSEVPALRTLLDGFADEFDQAGLGHVSEVFDAERPQRPGGTIAQAWNTAELLRATALLDRAAEAGDEDRS